MLLTGEAELRKEGREIKMEEKVHGGVWFLFNDVFYL